MTGKRIVSPSDRSADLQSAVSPNCIRHGNFSAAAPWYFEPSADCKSAIRQTASLRYGLVSAVLLCLAFHPISAWACAACYGASDAPMAKGMNAGIFSLLGVVVVVLGSIGGFFVYLARKSAPPAPPLISND